MYNTGKRRVGLIKKDHGEYLGMATVCEACESKIYVHEIEDYNLKALYDAYRKKNSIISLEKILEIPEKYSIGKRPISLLLGWGELTFTRYCDGDMPSKQYSDILQRIYEDPTYFKSVKEYHAMLNPADIEIYAKKMFEQTN